jgi:hypothetical protein
MSTDLWTLSRTEGLGPLSGPSGREDAEAASALKDPPVRAVLGVPQHTATPLILDDMCSMACIGLVDRVHMLVVCTWTRWNTHSLLL